MATDTKSSEPDSKPSKKPELVLENRTDCTLSIRGAKGRIVIAPLGAERVEAEAIERDELDAACAARVLQVHDPNEPPKLGPGFIAWPLSVAAFCILFATTSAEGYSAAERAAWGAAAVVCVLFAIAMALLIFTGLSQFAAMVVGIPRRLRELFYLLLVVLIVVAAPGAILYFGSDVPELLERTDESQQWTFVLIGIGVQLVTIVGASLLPVVLYFVFDREKLKTLREKFVRHVFRLDPAVRTRTDVDVKYGQLLDEAYGRRSQERQLPGARSPILLATAVMTLGWTIALLDPGLPDPNVSLSELLTPQATATTYAFLGAYFFTLNLVMRGYVRGDLRPKTYAQVATRTVGVVVLAFVLQELVVVAGGGPSSPTVLALAFLAGIVPETVLIRLQDFLRGVTRSGRSQRLIGRLAPIYETDPLTQLEGIDIYDRARLMDEGVTNVEGLAHHDLVELLLKTRIPASRLVDWVDQAILYIHCPSDEDEEARSSALRRLRGHGIRTATDLEHAYAAACARPDGEQEFLALVGGGNGRPPDLRVMLDAISDEDWMQNLRYWHSQKAVPRELRIPEKYQPGGRRATAAPELAAVPRAS